MKGNPSATSVTFNITAIYDGADNGDESVIKITTKGRWMGYFTFLATLTFLRLMSFLWKLLTLICSPRVYIKVCRLVSSQGKSTIYSH